MFELILPSLWVICHWTQSLSYMWMFVSVYEQRVYADMRSIWYNGIFPTAENLDAITK